MVHRPSVGIAAQGNHNNTLLIDEICYIVSVEDRLNRQRVVPGELSRRKRASRGSSHGMFVEESDRNIDGMAEYTKKGQVTYDNRYCSWPP